MVSCHMLCYIQIKCLCNSTWHMSCYCVYTIDPLHIKYWYSMIIQAIVDYEYLFSDICVGWPGSVHDACVFANSFVYKSITKDGLLENGDSCTILGKRIPICIIGDSAYPVHNWLMKPFSDNPNLTLQQCFNYSLSHARIVVENAS